ncbi:hypothetical protein [Paenibacillus sp. RC253]|uniref:hypothetical protein n=2 Tax=Paenibacillus TaxID=44249 RepID=UPI003834B344
MKISPFHSLPYGDMREHSTPAGPFALRSPMQLKNLKIQAIYHPKNGMNRLLFYHTHRQVADSTVTA